jgi:osmotically inducible protein OsmC
MTEFNRKGGALWSGDLKSGGGTISTESQALYGAPYAAETRFGDKAGTNPEELLAAAHSACFSMALASTLSKNGFDPVRADTNATCTVASKDGGYEITSMLLHVRAEVPGLDPATFHKLVAEADKGCPVSNLLRSGLEIQIDAELLEPAQG